MVRCLSVEVLLKRLQIVSVHVGNSPVVKVRVNPMEKLITLAHHCLRRSNCIGSGWPDEEINKTLGRHRSVIEIIETAADERKSLRRKIYAGGSKIELGIQPRLHRVLVGGSNVCQVVCHQRTHMTGNELGS